MTLSLGISIGYVNLEAKMTTEELATRVTQLEERMDRLERANGAAVLGPPRQGRKLSAKEFLMTKPAKSELQKVVALAHYLEHHEGLESFNVADLETVFRSAREKPPKNMNDAVNKNVSRGFLMEAREKKSSKKAWQLTSTGERFVDNDMA
jgi:hypothetical protein